MNDIQLIQLSKFFILPKNKSAIAALNQIDLSIPLNKITVIQGVSGCGKTTLLKVIAGLYDIDDGQILFNGLDITHVPANQRNIAYVSQSTILYPHMTVFDNIAYPLKQASVPPEEIKRRVFELSKIMNIGLLLSRKPKVLSGGQQQKVAIARALVKQPTLLLLDEPFSNLDPKTALSLLSLIKHLQALFQLTIILVTHHEKDANMLGDYFITMDNGEIIETHKQVMSDV